MVDPEILILLKYSLVEVVLICFIAGMMGVFVVNYRLAFFSDAISHSAFTGVALGLISGINPMISVVLFGVLIGLLVVYFRAKTTMAYDTIVGVFFSFSVALGIFLVSSSKGLFRNFHAFLYGDILLITPSDLIITLLLLTIIFLFITIYFDQLTLLGIDESYASSIIHASNLLKYIFSLLLGLVVTLSIKSVGILLVTALLIVPAASARAISKSIRGMFFNSIVISVLAGIGGIYLSVTMDASTGASIVMVACVIFLICTLWKTIFLKTHF